MQCIPSPNASHCFWIPLKVCEIVQLQYHPTITALRCRGTGQAHDLVAPVLPSELKSQHRAPPSVRSRRLAATDRSDCSRSLNLAPIISNWAVYYNNWRQSDEREGAGAVPSWLSAQETWWRVHTGPLGKEFRPLVINLRQGGEFWIGALLITCSILNISQHVDENWEEKRIVRKGAALFFMSIKRWITSVNFLKEWKSHGSS